MASKRMIASDIFEDDFYAGLTMMGRQLWIGLIVRSADDQGRFQDNCELIKSQIFPYDRISPDDLAAILCEMEKAGKIVRYKASGKRLIQIVNWWKYQTLSWANKSKYPAPDGWTDREKYHLPGNKVGMLNWDKQGGFDNGTYTPTYPPTYEVSNPTDERRGEEITIGATPESETGMEYRNNVWDILHGQMPGEETTPGPDIEWLPADTQELGASFMVDSGIPAPRKDSERSYWIKSLREMRLQGLTVDDLKAAVQKMRADQLTIKAPESVKAIALDLKASKKSGNNGGRKSLLPSGV